ncbi:anti-sigma F factor [Qingrenia yutianensis]|uniref:Anti-sigma F factor n=1 Tax=Qingrenia yutianensis TaxID=2763676 RepID=A0A926F8Y5_9FIRM|nr:anti-sigma F factor [Qingrenia yutianensis]MBC8595536.1 anti-sigma F factor [Qingrenia yutianensis]
MRENSAKITVMSRSENESFVRAAVSAFVSQLDPTLEELADIKTAVSEAVTNSIVHGYAEKKGDIMIDIYIKDDKVKITVTDNGCGIADVKEAMQPLFTTNTDGERSGMGFTVMETFMDNISVNSIVDVGTKVTMEKTIGLRTL